jgi:hypothetical protein
MSKKNSATFKEGDHVAVSPEAISCPNKSGQLISRTGLSLEQLRDGPMYVTRMPGDGQLHIKHPRLGRPFIVHSKFIVPKDGASV